MSRARRSSVWAIPPSVAAYVASERMVNLLTRQLEVTNSHLAEVVERLAHLEAQQRATGGVLRHQSTPSDVQSDMGKASTSATHMPYFTDRDGNEEGQEQARGDDEQ